MRFFISYLALSVSRLFSNQDYAPRIQEGSSDVPYHRIGASTVNNTPFYSISSMRGGAPSNKIIKAISIEGDVKNSTRINIVE
jgi:hypothetical protein